MSWRYEQIGRVFCVVINTFRNGKNKIAADLLKTPYGIAEFVIKNSTSLLAEAFSVLTKIEKHKFSFEEMNMIYMNNAVIETVSKKDSTSIKPILNYINKLFDYIYEIENCRIGRKSYV